MLIIGLVSKVTGHIKKRKPLQWEQRIQNNTATISALEKDFCSLSKGLLLKFVLCACLYYILCYVSTWYFNFYHEITGHLDFKLQKEGRITEFFY